MNIQTALGPSMKPIIIPCAHALPNRQECSSRSRPGENPLWEGRGAAETETEQPTVSSPPSTAFPGVQWEIVITYFYGDNRSTETSMKEGEKVVEQTLSLGLTYGQIICSTKTDD